MDNGGTYANIRTHESQEGHGSPTENIRGGGVEQAQVGSAPQAERPSVVDCPVGKICPRTKVIAVNTLIENRECRESPNPANLPRQRKTKYPKGRQKGSFRFTGLAPELNIEEDWEEKSTKDFFGRNQEPLPNLTKEIWELTESVQGGDRPRGETMILKDQDRIRGRRGHGCRSTARGGNRARRGSKVAKTTASQAQKLPTQNGHIPRTDSKG